MAESPVAALLAALDDRELVLGLACVPVDTLINRERCHVHAFAQRAARMEHLRPDQQEAVQAIVAWHNLRTGSHLPDEGYFRCLAIYGAAAEFIVNEANPAIEGDMPQWIDLDGLGYRGGGVMARRRKPASSREEGQ